MTLVELAEDDAGLILALADHLTKCQRTERRAEPFVTGLFHRDAIVALPRRQRRGIRVFIPLTFRRRNGRPNEIPKLRSALPPFLG